MSKTKPLPSRVKPKAKPTTSSKPKSSKPSSKPPTPSLSFPRPLSPLPHTAPPLRAHSPAYHHALLLEGEDAGRDLLRWFDGMREARNMPWRKAWLDREKFEGEGGEEEFEQALERRAYEVWVSEVMLQQTRVATVIPYFTSWIAQWPTVHALAAAPHADVLAAWKGLGYYSRATRLWEGAKAVVNASTATSSSSSPSSPGSKSTSTSKCAIPASPSALLAIPGIGPYTAGAISSIAFGAPEPVLDGNVARVLSRQLGLYVDVKDKKVADGLWDVAGRLVRHVAGGRERSEVPGLWNQALMELGSTVCTPRPRCGGCPVRGTCRVWGEGERLALGKKKGGEMEVEEECKVCEVVDLEDGGGVGGEGEEDADKPAKRRKTEKKAEAPRQANTLSNYFTRTGATKGAKVEVEIEKEEDDEEEDDAEDALDAAAPVLPAVEPPAVTPAHLKTITAYAALFPKRAPKKKVPEQDAVVCVVEARRGDDAPSEWLIEQRPAKGLLASLWQFPQHTLPASEACDPAARVRAAEGFLADMAARGGNVRGLESARHVGEVGEIVHVFSHLKLRMWVERFVVEGEEGEERGEKVVKRKAKAGEEEKATKWVETSGVDGETLSTGMRRCWGVVKDSA